jgi:hypothetical protein
MKILRSKVFTTIKTSELNKAYKFLGKKLKADKEAWMESYGIGKERRIPRAVVYWKEKKLKKVM